MKPGGRGAEQASAVGVGQSVACDRGDLSGRDMSEVNIRHDGNTYSIQYYIYYIIVIL